MPKLKQGFTLIEIMLVLVVLSMVVGLFAANLTPSPYRQLSREALRLQEVLSQASDEAVMQGRELALALPINAYQVLTYDIEQLQWAALTDKPFRHYSLPENVHLQLNSMVGSLPERRRSQFSRLKGSKSATLMPEILILSSGEMTPFTFIFSTPGFSEEVRLVSDGFSGIEIR